MTKDELGHKTELAVAKLLWDLKELRGYETAIRFDWQEEEWSHGQFLNFDRKGYTPVVVASWRYGRPTKRPTESMKWDGKNWVD